MAKEEIPRELLVTLGASVGAGVVCAAAVHGIRLIASGGFSFMFLTAALAVPFSFMLGGFVVGRLTPHAAELGLAQRTIRTPGFVCGLGALLAETASAGFPGSVSSALAALMVFTSLVGYEIACRTSAGVPAPPNNRLEPTNASAAIGIGASRRRDGRGVCGSSEGR